MEFRILGPLEVRDGERVLPLGGERRRAVLALLLLDANRVVSVDRLVAASGATHRRRPRLRPFRTTSAACGRSSASGSSRSRRDTCSVSPTESSTSTASCVSSTTRAAPNRRLRPSASPRRWRSGAVRRSPTSPASPPPVPRRTSRSSGSLQLEERIDADLALGRHAALVPELEQLVAAEPYRERLRRQLILALYRSGRQADALEAYARARRTFVDELGTEPGRELQELQRAVLAARSGARRACRRRAPPRAPAAR